MEIQRLEEKIMALQKPTKRQCTSPLMESGKENIPCEPAAPSPSPSMPPTIPAAEPVRTMICWVPRQPSMAAIWQQWGGIRRHFTSMPAISNNPADPATYWKLKTSGPDAAQWATHIGDKRVKADDAGKVFNPNIKAAISYMERLLQQGIQPAEFLAGLQAVADDKPVSDKKASSPPCPICLSEMCRALNLLLRGQNGELNGKKQKRPLHCIRDGLADRLLLL